MRSQLAVGFVLVLAACTSETDSGEAEQTRTVESLLATPPAAAGEKVELDVVVVVSQRNGKKWRAFVQDPGKANGIGVFCDSGATTPCTAAMTPMGTTGTFSSIWSPQVASKLEPVDYVSRGTAKVTYLDAPTKTAVNGSSGTPVHLTGGPWRVSNANLDGMKNPSYEEGDCTSGPPLFGVEVTDESDGTTFPLVLKWFDTITLTTDPTSCGAGKTKLADGMRFEKLGGLVEMSAFGTSALAVEPFSDADWRVQ